MHFLDKKFAYVLPEIDFYATLAYVTVDVNGYGFKDASSNRICSKLLFLL